MRIQHLRIGEWRHFNNIEIEVPDGAPIVCLVGGNGTGKSQILELIAAAAQKVGISEGYAGTRGNAFDAGADVEIRFFVAPGLFSLLDAEGENTAVAEIVENWDRTLTVKSAPGEGVRVYVGRTEDSSSRHSADRIVRQIRNSQLIHYLMLDADRAYPRLQVQSHEMGSPIGTDWVSSNKSRSFLLTKDLYGEWFRYLLGTENQETSKYIAEVRKAADKHKRPPKFIDKMLGYRDAIRRVLPHLLFTGINSQRREINFDSSGIDLTFDQLSGGEREIAFLIGQIERFGLRTGILLVDEPELHLNNDMLRSWIGFLKDTVEQGQIWLASHSLEVVEVAGQEASFLLERNAVTRKVDICATLEKRPVVSTLSRALGSPAFSISALAFVLIEGEEEIGERERFRLLCDAGQNVRYIESGNCREVIRRIESLRGIAKESSEPLIVGAVIDRDWRSQSEIQLLEAKGLFVLKVREVENFLLHPVSVARVMTDIGQDPSRYPSLLLEACDQRAGRWIFDAARTNKAFEEFPPPSDAVKALIQMMHWSQFADADKAVSQIISAYSLSTQKQEGLLKRHLEARVKSYGRVREDGSLWKECDGKDVFRALANRIGFADSDASERAIIGCWQRNPDLVPEELKQLRAYVGSLRPN